jgi:hypothetical protein
MTFTQACRKLTKRLRACSGIHINLLLNIPPEIARSIAAGDPAPAGVSEKETIAYNQRKALALAYLIEQSTRPQTIGYSLADSPAGLAAWMLDHDPHSYEQIAHAFEGHPEGGLTRDATLDNITLYWVTNTGTSAAQLYWENARTIYKGEITVSAAFTVLPGELWRAPRTWVERTYKTSFTSMRSTRAATSPRGNSRSC